MNGKKRLIPPLLTENGQIKYTCQPEVRRRSTCSLIMPGLMELFWFSFCKKRAVTADFFFCENTIMRISQPHEISPIFNHSQVHLKVAPGHEPWRVHSLAMLACWHAQWILRTWQVCSCNYRPFLQQKIHQKQLGIVAKKRSWGKHWRENIYK